LNGLYGYGVDTYGVGLGDYDEEHITIDVVNGIRMFDAAGLKLVHLDKTGDLILGYVATNKSNLFWDVSEGRLNFRGGTGGTDIQAYIDTDGSLVAGGGDMKIDSTGFQLNITAAFGDGRSIRWINTSDNEIARLFGYWNTGVSQEIFLQTLGQEAYGGASLLGLGSAGGIATLGAGIDGGGATRALIAEHDPAGTGISWSYAREHFKVGQGLHVGNINATSPTDDVISCDGDGRFAGGLAVGSSTANPGTSDLRVGGGVYIGATTTDAPTGELQLTGSITQSTAIWGRWRRETDTTLTTSTPYTIVWLTEDADTDAMWSSGTQIAPNTSGTYIVSCNVQFDSNGSAGMRRVILRRNGSTNIGTMQIDGLTGADTWVLAVGMYTWNGSTDYVVAEVQQNSGSNLDMLHADISIARIA
jgi:hypothetical protein